MISPWSSARPKTQIQNGRLPRACSVTNLHERCFYGVPIATPSQHRAQLFFDSVECHESGLRYVFVECRL
jgi:hypothetical protein